MADSDGIEPHRTGEVRRETVALRRLRMSDAAAVHEAFASAGDMARQGDVTTAEGGPSGTSRACSRRARRTRPGRSSRPTS